MNSTALGATAEKEGNIIFISDAHEKFYYEKLKEVRYQDVYHKALVYCLGISNDTRRNVKKIYDFETGCVKTECLHEGWQTSGSEKVVRMAFNLYCNGTPSFSCPKNPDVERFLKNSAIEFTKKNQSVTYLVFDISSMELVGYFTIALKPLTVRGETVSKTMKKKLMRVSEIDEQS